MQPFRLTHFLRQRALCTGALAILVLNAPLAGSIALSQAAEEPYRLSIGDVVAVSVFGSAELSGDFPVGPDGTIAFPLVGNVDVTGLTPAEMSARLNRDLSEYVSGVSVTATVSRYAPVFIVGEVQSPGRYEFRPGMTTLELVALGGGMRRGSAELGSSQLQMIAARQDYGDLEFQVFGQEVARARIQAELDAAEFKFDLPASEAEPARREIKARIIAGERRLFEIARTAVDAEKHALLEQEKSYDREIETISASIELHDQEIALLLEDVAAQKSLVERGLTARSNLREAERGLSSMRRDALELGSFLANLGHTGGELPAAGLRESAATMPSSAATPPSAPSA
jgi:polysaccharide biosynthesis/export protein